MCILTLKDSGNVADKGSLRDPLDFFNPGNKSLYVVSRKELYENLGL